MERIVEENINTLEYWNNRFKTEKQHVWEPADIIKRISAEIPLNRSVLDVGIGGGIVCEKLRATRPDLDYSSCDWSEEAIALLRVRADLHFTNLFVWDVRTPPVPLMQFDVVLSTEMLEHLENPALAVAHMAEMARKKLIVTVPNKNAVTSPEHIWSYSTEDILALLSPYGDAKAEVCRWEGFNIMGVVCRLS